nr:uncharacterized protein LOC107281840 [Oryza sativa Japonica Group]
MVTPFVLAVLTLAQADTEARKMIGDVSVTEFSQLLTRQAAGRVNRVYDGELPPRANTHKVDDDAGPSRKRMRGQVKKAPRKRRAPDSDADDEETVKENDGEEEDVRETEAASEKAAGEVADTRAETPGYTPTPSPELVETRVESNCSPLRQKDVEGAKAVVAIAAAKVAKGGSIKKTSRKRLVDVGRVFSDDKSSNETPTSPAGRSLGLSTAPGVKVDTGRAGGSAAGASASTDQVVKTAARVFGSPVRQPVVSPLALGKGKKTAVETSVLDYSLAAPYFAPGDFETQGRTCTLCRGGEQPRFSGWQLESVHRAEQV